jgi:hypothetical protein
LAAFAATFAARPVYLRKLPTCCIWAPKFGRTIGRRVAGNRTACQYLRAQGDVIADETRHIVSDLSYAGDEGGIVCHMLPPKEGGGALVLLLTQVHVPQSLPFAAAVTDYQKHRVKKLRKQGRVN